jgi:integrase/recombinase XerD
MALSKQAKVLTRQQVDVMFSHVGTGRNGLRNQVIFLLSVRAGLRAKEIANLKWSMVIGSDGELADYIHLTDDASKGKSGRIIPINKALKSALGELFSQANGNSRCAIEDMFVIQTERASQTSAQAVVNLFQKWYRNIGFVGCSSHSGRRTFITNVAKKISTVGGSLRDVQFLAGHSSLQTTQRYIEGDSEARKRVVDLV